MSGVQIFRVEPDDDMASLRERLNGAPLEAAAVLVPDGTALLRNPVNLQLLKRYAGQMAAQVLLVTNDRLTRAAARREHVPVYGSLKGIPRRYRAQLAPEVVETKLPTRRRPFLFLRWVAGLSFWVVGLAVLAAAGLLAAFVAVVLAPSATVKVVPAVDELETVIDITSGTQIRVLDSDEGQMPARSVGVLIEDMGQVDTTGRKRVPDATAAGTVVFANRSLNPQTIAKGTVVRTATGVSIRFRTEDEAQLPGSAGATARVAVKAIDPGPTGNVKAGTINIVEGRLAFQVSVLNDEDLKGGNERETRYVTLQDRTAARDAILKQIRPGSYAALRATIGADDILPAESLIVTVNETSFDKPLDAEGTYLTGKVRATVSGLVLQGEDLKKLVAARLRDQVREGFELLPEGIAYAEPTNVKYSEGIVTLRIAATAQSRARISAREVRNALVGVPEEDAAAVLAERFQLAQPAEVEVTNAWLRRLSDIEVLESWLGRLPGIEKGGSPLGRLPFVAHRIDVKVVNQ